MTEEAIIDAIYEAGAMPENWQPLLDRIADLAGARGGLILYARPDYQEKRVCSPAIEQLVDDFYAEGWGGRNSRISRYLERPPYAGFLTDGDLHSEEEMRTLPIYRDFLLPRGAGIGAATLIQGADSDSFALTFEAFADLDAARSALLLLDRLRPHIGRAVTLSGRLDMERSRGAVASLDMIGTPAGVLNGKGRLLAANGRFEAVMGNFIVDGRSRLRLADDRSDQRFAEALGWVIADRAGSSLALRPEGGLPFAMHLIPVRGAARDIFSDALTLVMLSDPAESTLPGRDLIQALFDLTPTEARIAREVALGAGVTPVAEAAGLSRETVRSHLKVIFQKTNTRRQSELALLLPRFGLPDGRRGHGQAGLSGPKRHDGMCIP